jgi:hypothetical protein
VYAILRVVLIVVLAATPFYAGNELETHNWRWMAPFLVVTGVLAVVEILEAKDARTELDQARKELEVVRHRLNRQRERGSSMSRLMGVVIPPLIKLEKLTEMVAELKKQGKSSPAEIDELVKAGIESADAHIKQLLVAVEEEVRAFWDLPENSIKSNLMIAYRISACSPDALTRLSDIVDFCGFGRELKNYHTVLELTIWGTPDPQIPPLAIPVEDPTVEGSEKRLIPGAPMAFALKEDTVVHDTQKILSFVPEKLDQQVRDRLVEYFSGKRVRSFVCLTLKEDARPIGVLNIQSDRINICGPEGEEKGTITKGVEHYRLCLEQLIASQRKLRDRAS